MTVIQMIDKFKLKPKFTNISLSDFGNSERQGHWIKLRLGLYSAKIKP